MNLASGKPGSIDYVLSVVANAFPPVGLKAYLIGGMAVQTLVREVWGICFD